MITELTAQRFAEFKRFVESKGGGGRWLVMTHDNPDPDAIAAAGVLSKILRVAFHRRVTTAYGGLIGRAENQQMVKVLGIRLSHRRHLIWKNYRHFALVDTQPRTGNNQLNPTITPDAVFDHHPVRRTTQGVPFIDIRPDYGATATILVEYLLASGIEVSRRNATALIYAIRSETQDFGREFAGPDRKIYDELLPMVDKRALARIQSAPLPATYFRDLHQALENLESVGKLIVSNLGELEQPDIVPEIADLLLRMERKTWSLASGLYNGRIYLSIRTSNSRADAGRVMRRLVGKKGKGGGHGMTAGGWVDLEGADRAGAEALQHQLAARLAKSLKLNPAKLAPLDLKQLHSLP